MNEYHENSLSTEKLPLVNPLQFDTSTEAEERLTNRLINVYVDHVRQGKMMATECLATYTQAIPHGNRLVSATGKQVTRVYRRNKRGNYTESLPLMTERTSVFLADGLRRIGGKVIATNNLLGVGISLGHELSIIDLTTDEAADDYLHSFHQTVDQLEQVRPDRIAELEKLLQD